MKVVETQMSLVALTLEEINLIIDSLRISYHEWGDEEAGALLSQFNKVKSSLESIRNQVLDN